MSESSLSRGRGSAALYAQLAALLRDEIQAGVRRVGDRVESEPELTRRFGVSRATVTKALDVLESEGLIRREHGRGTFVAHPRLHRPLPELTGFTEHVQSRGLTPGQRVIDVRHAVAGDTEELIREFAPSEPVVIVERVRLADEEPVGIHTTALPGDVAARIGLEEAVRAGSVSLYALMAEHGIELDRAEEYLRAEAAGSRDSELLGVEPTTPLMRVRRLSRDGDGRLVETVDARYLGWFYEYRIELERPVGKPAPLLTLSEEGSL